MSEERFVKYGDRMMQIDPGTSLEQIKELMARHFPELADPKVEPKKDGEKIVYTFSKKAGHKGNKVRRPVDRLIAKLLKMRRSVCVDQRVVEHFATRQGNARVADEIASGMAREVERVTNQRGALAELPVANKPTGAVL